MPFADNYYKSEKHNEHKNAKFYTLTNSKSSYDNIISNNKGSIMSRGNVKGMLREFINENKNHMKNSYVQISYITDQNLVNLPVVAVNEWTDDTIDKFMVDPCENYGIPSGEYNNLLTGKQLYGLHVTILKNSIPRRTVRARNTGTSGTATRPSRYSFQF